MMSFECTVAFACALAATAAPAQPYPTKPIRSRTPAHASIDEELERSEGAAERVVPDKIDPGRH